MNKASVRNKGTELLRIYEVIGQNFTKIAITLMEDLTARILLTIFILQLRFALCRDFEFENDESTEKVSSSVFGHGKLYISKSMIKINLKSLVYTASKTLSFDIQGDPKVTLPRKNWISRLGLEQTW